jgi:hypothetical protein
VISDSERIGLVYNLPIGLSQDWKNFTSEELTSAPHVIDSCKKALSTAFTFMMQNQVLHRAIRPESLVYNETNNQAFFTLCGHFEALFYLETKQNPAFQGQFQANFYKTERLNSFSHYNINDEYFGFAKTWYFLDLVKNLTSAKTIDSKLRALTISDEHPLSTKLNVLLGDNLQAKHQIFSESFQLELPSEPIEEIEAEQVPILQTTVEEIPPVVVEKPKIVIPSFKQPTIIQNPIGATNNAPTKEQSELASIFHWYNYAFVIGGIVVLLLTFVYIYSNINASNVEYSKQPTAKNEISKETSKEDSQKPSIKKENNLPALDKTSKIQESKKESKTDLTKDTENAKSEIVILDNTYGIYQLDELSKLIDQAGTLSLNERKLLLNKTNEIYSNLPIIANKLSNSDQRKVCNYRSKFANHLKRNGFTLNNSIEYQLDPYCN